MYRRISRRIQSGSRAYARSRRLSGRSCGVAGCFRRPQAAEHNCVSTAVDPDDVVWIDAKSKQPLCDVPWLGTSVVLSNGNVNFCCFSDAIVGNVNEQTFEQIWNGARMRDVRRALSEQRLPAECQSTSCPIFRGDTAHYLIDRMNGNDPARDRIEPSMVKECLRGSALSLSSDTVDFAETLEIAINLRWRGAPLLADLFIAVRRDDGLCLFL